VSRFAWFIPLVHQPKPAGNPARLASHNNMLLKVLISRII
jgi:hypothetical protein